MQHTPKEVPLGMGMALANFMTAGTVMEIYLPSTLGYGAVGSSDPVVPPDSVLIYTVQLLGLNGPGQEPLSLAGAPTGGAHRCPKRRAGALMGSTPCLRLSSLGRVAIGTGRSSRMQLLLPADQCRPPRAVQLRLHCRMAVGNDGHGLRESVLLQQQDGPGSAWEKPSA